VKSVSHVLNAFVEVLWDDADFSTDRVDDPASMPDEALCRTFGIVIRNDKRSVWVAHEEQLEAEGDVGSYRGVTRIPWSLVRHIHVF